MFRNWGSFILNWQEHSPILFSSSGMICAILLVLEMCEKLFDDSAKNWSPLVLFGPQVWIPVVTDKGRLVAVHMLIHGFIYFLVCGKLLKALQERSVSLACPWFVMHSALLLYQILLLVLNRELYGRTDIAVAVSFTVLNALSLVSVYFTMRRWYYNPEKAESWHGSYWEELFESRNNEDGPEPLGAGAKTRSRAPPLPEPETEPEEICSD